MYVVLIEDQITAERFRVDAKRLAMIARPDPATNPPPGVYEVILSDDPEPGRKYWTHNLNLAKLGH